ncbi:60S ribosomal protein L32-2-like [Actinidia eriantha]|uniref:60S ribosomal protein L32-2-like n=1 Tax=Actinidia eriantha TaxID=165200 RepID=UPI0025878127|nr:60S ribosomal protein L32-2-like [Actinidia eriantha]
MAVPLLTKKIVKKRVKKFKRPQSDWKLSEGPRVLIPVFKGCTLTPNIGYGSDNKTRHYLPNGFKKFIVSFVLEPYGIFGVKHPEVDASQRMWRSVGKYSYCSLVHLIAFGNATSSKKSGAKVTLPKH